MITTIATMTIAAASTIAGRLGWVFFRQSSSLLLAKIAHTCVSLQRFWRARVSRGSGELEQWKWISTEQSKTDKRDSSESVPEEQPCRLGISDGRNYSDDLDAQVDGEEPDPRRVGQHMFDLYL